MKTMKIVLTLKVPEHGGQAEFKATFPGKDRLPDDLKRTQVLLGLELLRHAADTLPELL